MPIRRSIDSETTGIDLHHGALPFLVTICDKGEEPSFWEAPVDPETREPQWTEDDLDEIQAAIDEADELYLQNGKFDGIGLTSLFKKHGRKLRWNWGKVKDTLFAGHLLKSNQAHDLTTMVLVYCHVNIKPYEDAIDEATTEARRYVKANYPTWMVAAEGLKCMPSAKASKNTKKKSRGDERDSLKKFDMWLPRAVAKQEWSNSDAFRYLLSIAQHDEVNSVSDEEISVSIYESLSDAEKAILIKKSGWEWHPPGLGDNGHKWWTVLSLYANVDSISTGMLIEEQLRQIEALDLMEIYECRLKLIDCFFKMDMRGLSLSKKRSDDLLKRLTEEFEEANAKCVALSGGKLKRVPDGITNELRDLIFNDFKLVPCEKTENGGDSLNKRVIETWLIELPEGSREKSFIRNFKICKRRLTAISFLNSYEKYRLHDGSKYHDSFYIYPSSNPTGTDTLRGSTSNPNEQQISKQEDGNLREAFGPGLGREWWSMDAQNIELRIPAYEAGESAMIEIFDRPKDPPYFGSYHLLAFDVLHPEKFAKDGKKCKDIYEATWYQWTKNGNFAVGYGSVEQSGTADKAYHVLGAFRRIKSKFKKIHGPGGLNDRMIQHARDYGYVETIPDKSLGCKRGYPLWCKRTSYGGVLETVPLNYHVQGSAMWWMGKAMIRCQAYLDKLNEEFEEPQYFMVAQIHDELMFDFPKGSGSEPWKTHLSKIDDLRKLMELGGEDIGVPTTVTCTYHPIHWAEGIDL